MKINLIILYILIAFYNFIICQELKVDKAESQNIVPNIPENSNLSSERQMRVSQGYGDPEYNKFQAYNKPLKNVNESEPKSKNHYKDISADSRLAAVRQMRLAQRYGDPEYKKFQSSSIMRFYGFAGYELLMVTRQTVEVPAIGSYLYPARFLADANGKDIYSQAKTVMDAATSRLGIFFNPDQGGSKNMYAILELDFRGTAVVNKYTAKIRHSFGEIAWNSGVFLFGQYYHPLFLAESFPRTINFNMGGPFEPQAIVPQLRVTQSYNNFEFVFAFLGQSYLYTYGPEGGVDDYIQDAIVPNLNFEFKWRYKKNFYGFSIDYLRVMPSLYSSNSKHQDFKVNKYASAISTEIFLHNVFEWGELNLQAILSQNGANQVLISGYAVKSVNNITGARTYVPTNAIAFWLDTFYLFFKKKMQLGLFFGGTINLGAFTKLYLNPEKFNQPNVYAIADPAGSDASKIAYLYRISTRYAYDMDSFRFGIELEWDLISFGSVLNEYAIPIKRKAVNAFSPFIDLEYVF